MPEARLLGHRVDGLFRDLQHSRHSRLRRDLIGHQKGSSRRESKDAESLSTAIECCKPLFALRRPAAALTMGVPIRLS